MPSVSQIEKAVAELPPEQLAVFRAWFERFDAERFDRRIEQDAARGSLDSFADEALAEARDGHARRL